MSALLKRLDQIVRMLNIHGARTIVIEVPTMLVPIEGSIENDGVVAPEIRAMADELLNEAGVTDNDMVIEIASFYQQAKTNGHSEPEPARSTKLISIT
jgi:hypothetical protein